MSTELIFTDARLLLRDRETPGTVVVRDGRIADIDEQPCGSPSAIRLEGSILAPGLVELHTDNLERFLRPRPGVAWPALPALMAHDAELVAAGITAVCDALVVGDGWEREHRRQLLEPALSALRTAREAGMLRADQRLHLRCEVADENTFEIFRPLADDPHLALVSLMDHTPGPRQFADVSQYRAYFGERYGMSEAEIDTLIERARGARAPGTGVPAGDRLGLPGAPHSARKPRRCDRGPCRGSGSARAHDLRVPDDRGRCARCPRGRPAHYHGRPTWPAAARTRATLRRPASPGRACSMRSRRTMRRSACCMARSCCTGNSTCRSRRHSAGSHGGWPAWWGSTTGGRLPAARRLTWWRSTSSKRYRWCGMCGVPAVAFIDR